ncbi:uncharacterized protein LOC116001274 [Ipomoea triloba]|uniref:uncharacterized protein LOC116001274 n=2 Tax=Ipomoea triloba TaxID=35885 RepID=UPI00125D1595|nr:uncharacterized protein LOC116001274 [Ipomoea triloba]
MNKEKPRYSNHITAIKPKTTKLRPFIVADTETLLDEKSHAHVPYAVGYMLVSPGDDVGSKADYEIETRFSESHVKFLPKMEDRSKRMMFEFLNSLERTLTVNKSVRTVYFHNLAKFDGIFFMRHYVERTDNIYRFKPLIRNHMLYELKVHKGRKLLMRFRDSCNLLPGSLASLAERLCPQLGPKGSIQHQEVRLSNLQERGEELLSYMRQDIRLLGGVMLKAQEIYWLNYQIYIEELMTLSSLATRIFRMKYYDEKRFPIHIPNRNEDTFIRRGYYGGHTDAYIPSGENLYYYDVNSLYPFIMKTYPMPGGVPVWRGNLEGERLDDLFGFIEALVVCPSDIIRPFLPYRDKNSNTLLFPTGQFAGVYYSEEFQYARDLGYTIIPLRGYLFEKKASPFEAFVSELYGSRQRAKKEGDEAMSYVYKTLMNSLYGRFGINPVSTVTELCDRERYEEFLRKDNFTSANQLTENYYIVSYITNRAEDKDWNPPRISAVQISAAITACSRINMYQYISRDDCYYTDTDSVVLGSPIPDEVISSTELGKFKLEYFVKKGIFLAPKSYYILTTEEKRVLKHKGIAKSLVNEEWFETQYAELHKTKQIPVQTNFQIDWESLNVMKREKIVNLGIKVNTKREPVFDNNQTWVDTTPLNVTDYAGQEKRILEYNLECLQKENAMKDREIEQLRSLIASISSDSLRKDEQGRSQPSDDPNNPAIQSHSSPTLFKHPPIKNKNKNKNKHTYRGKKKKKKPG